ncbi:anoctamin-4-like isoform X4 [Haliotis rubra]|uniref:anoctamin-4-like isoform X4 n=1 Tax=Haliotis rubra TaxID=36100 RepID=UPI001EE4F25F|nr:anoctamin-4-like isoform X4 [Haliotis rubra]
MEGQNGSYISRIPVAGPPPQGVAAPPPIGFEMQNMDPSPPGPDPGRVSPVPPPPPPEYNNGVAVDMEQPAPIGFEGAGEGHANAGFETEPDLETTPNVEPVEAVGMPSAEHFPDPPDPQPVGQPIGFEGQGHPPPPKGHDLALASAGAGYVAAPDLVHVPGSVENGEKPNATKHELQDPEESREDLVLLSREDNDQLHLKTDPESMFFNDGRRRIDFVLAYKTNTGSNEEKRKKRRDVFEENLRNEGLELEIEEKKAKPLGKQNKIQQLLKEDNLYFVKVHATWEVLTRYAEIMSMKMPLQDQGDYDDAENDMIDNITTCWSKCPTPFDIDPDRLPEMSDYFTAAFSRERVDQGMFIIKDQDTFFNTAQRSLIVYQILLRCVYEDLGDKRKNKFGIKKMLSTNSYVAAYALHEGNFKSDHSLLTRGKANDRHLLYEVWAKPSMWYKFQPLDYIRRYFGEKIGIYFSWLGYYTSMLIPSAIIGLVVTFFGLGTLWDDVPSQEICLLDKAGNTTMCPLCDKRCSFWRLKRSCLYSQVTYLFDNPATVAFAVFMALWATFFAEMWKRRQAEIEYDWDVADFEEEETLRPEFEASVTRMKKNPINHTALAVIEEPYLSLGSRLCRYMSSLWVVLFMLCVVVAAVFGVIVYRITVSALLYGTDQEEISQRASTITSATAACINLVIIIVLGRVYLVIAEVLTNFETHRTQTEWEDSFTLKMFLFQFVNHYASLFYIAFFKGKLTGRPGSYNRAILGSRQEECDPAGCLIELCIQLGVIMVGKQTFNNFKEVILPKLMNWFKSRKVSEEEKETLPRWEEDYNLSTMPDLGLFDEYLEMVIQYGFVTIFVAAFPLAPLFALLNNVIEVRLDAYKFVTQWRRPLAARAQDIGVWFGILRGISTVAVASNACIIAFTSEFIPKLVYRFAYGNDTSLDGYIQFSLSEFRVNDYENSSFPADLKTDEFGVVTTCSYRDYRDATKNYRFSVQFWEILTAKLAFIIAFILVVVFLSWLVSYLVPDIPRTVKLQMLREKHLAKEAVLQAEALRRENNLRRRKPETEGPLY